MAFVTTPLRPDTTHRRGRAILAALATLLIATQGCGGPPLEPWHTERLTEEFTAAKSDEVRTFQDYRELEDRLFTQLEQQVYAQVETGPEHALVRYSSGSPADPHGYRTNWNRSIELSTDAPVGGVLMLHGMSDSPYSLRALAETLHANGYWVISMRMPGHGTAPSGLKYIKPEDMVAAVQLGMEHLAAKLGDKPIHMVGYSTGAALALNFALDAVEGKASPVPASLVLVSPAIRVHGAAAFASVKDTLSAVPGLGGMAWLSVLPEFDPYKYNSFASNAGDVVHQLTRTVDARIGQRARSGADPVLPPVLAFKSTVDSTVTTEAIVDNLLSRLKPGRHELVLFDINRSAPMSTVLIDDPGPLTNRLLADETLPFAITFIGNETPHTARVVALRKAPYSAEAAETEELDLEWPRGVISLSHIALPFPPDDPLYGRQPPEDSDIIFLGEMAIQGERGLVKLPGEWLLRMRYNPFYPVIEKRVLEWFQETGQQVRLPAATGPVADRRRP